MLLLVVALIVCYHDIEHALNDSVLGYGAYTIISFNICLHSSHPWNEYPRQIVPTHPIYNGNDVLERVH
jgi:hypothetical protein